MLMEVDVVVEVVVEVDVCCAGATTLIALPEMQSKLTIRQTGMRRGNSLLIFSP
jgi:hypothetical protein